MKHLEEPRKSGFTLIELLIVIAIILILIAIALPNFLAAQTRARATRAQADMKNMATAIEFFRTEHSHYPIGTDNPSAVPDPVRETFEQYGDYGFYTFRTVFSGDSAATLGYYGLPTGTPVGIVPGLTTPVAYVAQMPTDPFSTLPGFITYSYREDRHMPLKGWILTSFGPDKDESENVGKAAGSEPSRTRFLPLVDARASGRHGDISERGGHPGSNRSGFALGEEPPRSLLQQELEVLSYSPTNGTTSEGDLYRIGP